MTKEFEIRFKNGNATFNTDNVLWCAWTIDDLNNNGQVKITEEQFQEFVHQCNTGFNELCSEYANEMFSDFCKRNQIEEDDD